MDSEGYPSHHLERKPFLPRERRSSHRVVAQGGSTTRLRPETTGRRLAQLQPLRARLPRRGAAVQVIWPCRITSQPLASDPDPRTTNQPRHKRSSGPARPRPSRLCSVEACGRRHFGRGLCAHSTRNDGDARPITNETGNPPGLEGRGVSIVLILGFVLGGSQKDAVGEPMVGVQNKR